MTPADALKLYETRINLHVFDELVPLIAPDATFWFTDGSHTGIEEIRRAFERTWNDLQDETYWLEDLEWIALGDRAAACTYQFHWKTTIDGVVHAGAGRGTTVLRLDDGSWKIAHEHLSRFPVATTSATAE